MVLVDPVSILVEVLQELAVVSIVGSMATGREIARLEIGKINVIDAANGVT